MICLDNVSADVNSINSQITLSIWTLIVWDNRQISLWRKREMKWMWHHCNVSVCLLVHTAAGSDSKCVSNNDIQVDSINYAPFNHIFQRLFNQSYCMNQKKNWHFSLYFNPLCAIINTIVRNNCSLVGSCLSLKIRNMEWPLPLTATDKSKITIDQKLFLSHAENTKKENRQRYGIFMSAKVSYETKITTLLHIFSFQMIASHSHCETVCCETDIFRWISFYL